MGKNSLNIYQTALNLKEGGFPQHGEGYYLYTYQGGKKIITLKPDDDNSYDSEIYVPTKQELTKECKEIFTEIFKYFSTEYFSDIIVDLTISEGKVKFDGNQKKTYRVSHHTEEEIYRGLVSLYFSLKYRKELEYSKKQLRNYSIIWFMVGAITVIIYRFL
jgi:hypothetical protein